MSQPGSGWWVASVGLFGDLAGVGRRDGEQICAGNVRFLRPEELRILTGLRLHTTPGAILHPAAILVQSVNGTAEGPGLVLYPRQSCPSIALGLLLDWGLGQDCVILPPIVLTGFYRLYKDCRIVLGL